MNDLEPVDDRWYTTTQVGEMIGFSRDTVVSLIEEGRIRASRAKREYRIRGAEVRRYIADAEGCLERSTQRGHASHGEQE